MVGSQHIHTHHVVIVGGGFGGLYAATALGGSPARVTLVDRRNFHLFQPLLYQVATGHISSDEIASPLRATLSPYQNIEVLMAEVQDILPEERKVVFPDGELDYDTLILATGAIPYYFGHDDWIAQAPGLKTIEDGLNMRRQVLCAFEAAEREADPEERRAWMTFVVVGAGSAGVELCGALGELALHTLEEDFRHIDPTEATLLLLEGANRILPLYPPELSAKAERVLQRLGITVRTGALVTDISGDVLTIGQGADAERIRARTILWTAGIQASPIAQVLAARAGVTLDRMSRVLVEPDLTVENHPEIFVVGDLAHYTEPNGRTLPAVAPVAIQEGQYVARLIRKRLKGQTFRPFRYFDRGNLAVIGRNAAVAEVRGLKFGGFLAWLLWLLVHILYLIGFDNKVLVMFRWFWTYVTRRRGARVIVREGLVSEWASSGKGQDERQQELSR